MAGGGVRTMWQDVGACSRGVACGRVWAHVAGGGYMSQGLCAYGRGEGWRHVAGAGDMWQGVGACDRGL